jgi:hypothetical protein
LRPGTRIEQHADNGEIERGAGAGRRVTPVRAFVDERPMILAGDDEVAPARMQRDGKRRIALSRGGDYEIDRGIEAPEVDSEVRQLAIQPEREHAIRTLADCLGVQ